MHCWGNHREPGRLNIIFMFSSTKKNLKGGEMGKKTPTLPQIFAVVFFHFPTGTMALLTSIYTLKYTLPSDDCKLLQNRNANEPRPTQSFPLLSRSTSNETPLLQGLLLPMAGHCLGILWSFFGILGYVCTGMLEESSNYYLTTCLWNWSLWG